MLKIHEMTTASGQLAPVFLRADAGTLALVGEEDIPLPDGALEAVMGRYGKPLGEGVSLVPVAAIDLGEGRALRHVRHLALYDVIARDYLVYERPDGEALCALATTVAGALDHLGRAARAR